MKWRAIEVRLGHQEIQKIGWLRFLWGADIWIEGLPVLKLLILANIIVWLILFI